MRDSVNIWIARDWKIYEGKTEFNAFKIGFYLSHFRMWKLTARSTLNVEIKIKLSRKGEQKCVWLSLMVSKFRQSSSFQNSFYVIQIENEFIVWWICANGYNIYLIYFSYLLFEFYAWLQFCRWQKLCIRNHHHPFALH